MKILYFVTFAAGALIGFGGAYVLLKKKYDERSQQEINDVKESFKNYYENKCKVLETTAVEEKENKSDITIEDFNKTAKENGYFVDESKKPYSITPEQFGEFDEYKIVSLNYYPISKKVTDDKGNEIYNVENLIGENFADNIGEYEDDVAYIRNEKEETDYEIIEDSSEE